MPVAVIAEQRIERLLDKKTRSYCAFRAKDCQDVWREGPDETMNGALILRPDSGIPEKIEALNLDKSTNVRILLILHPDVQGKVTLSGVPHAIRAFDVKNDEFNEIDLMVIPRESDIFDRIRGVFETDQLRKKKVAVIGLGSGGSFIARELCKSGVGNFLLVDHDRLESGNICRHECGLRDLGRKKVAAMAELLLDRNPALKVETMDLKVSGKSIGKLKNAIDDVDLVICATDNRESRLLVNRICLELDKTLLFGAVFRRAYGGQILRVIPHLTPCYQCFVSALPGVMEDQEISSAESAATIAYSDRPVAIEPGLSTDILPVALQMAKMSILELLRGTETTLSSLFDDIVAPLHLWINRREKGTDYEKLQPMENNIDEMTVLRWYGIFIPKDPNCPACGDYEADMMRKFEIDVEDLDLEEFGG